MIEEQQPEKPSTAAAPAPSPDLMRRQKIFSVSSAALAKEKFWSKILGISIMFWMIVIIGAFIGWTLYFTRRDNLREAVLNQLFSVQIPLNLDIIKENDPFPSPLKNISSKTLGDERLWKNYDFLTIRGNLSLPSRNEKNQPVFSAYSSDVKNKDFGISFLISDLGLNEDVMDWAIDLPPSVTLGFSPYAPDLQQKIALARSAGHEVILTLPTKKALSAFDGGPLDITPKASPNEQLQSLQNLLGSVTGYVGIAADLSNFFPESFNRARLVALELSKLGIFLLDTGNLGDREKTQLRVAGGLKSLYTEPDARIINPVNKDEINKIIDQYVAVSKKRSLPVLLEFSAFPNVVDVLYDRIQSLSLGSNPVNLLPFTARNNQ